MSRAPSTPSTREVGLGVTATNPDHLATLDGLRGVAALVVLLLHSLGIAKIGQNPPIPHAHLAVDFFFLLSGFIVCKAYERRLQTSLGVASFAWIRLRRLYPMLLAGVLLGAMDLALRLVATHTLNPGEFGVATVSALLFLPTRALYLHYPNVLYPVDAPEWSLFFELAINLVYACVVRFLSDGVTIALALTSAVALVVVGTISHGLDVGVLGGDFLYGFVRVTFPFLAGVLVYRHRPTRWRFGSLVSILVAIATTAILVAPFGRDSAVYELVSVLVFFPAIIVVGSACRCGRTLGAVFLWAGGLSYPLYILHHPVIRFVTSVAQRTRLGGNAAALIAMCLVAAIVASWAALKVWDQPVRDWLGTLRTKRSA